MGEEAPISASTVARLKERWNAELAEWRARPLDDLEVAYMWVDGVYVKAGLEREKAAILVVMAALSDGSKVVLSVVPGYRESTRSWSEVLRDLRDRGLNCPRLVVGDGHLGIWGALRNVWPEAGEQRCWNHKILNVLDKLPKRQHDQARLMLRNIPYAETRAEAERLRKVFTRWCGDHSYETAREAIERDWERMVTFYDYPREHWRHLRTTNPVESPFAALRLRTDAARRYKRVDRAIAVIWKMLMVAEKRFRRLQAPAAAGGADGGRPPRGPIRGWDRRRGYGREGRRLITVTPLLTQPPCSTSSVTARALCSVRGTYIARTGGVMYWIRSCLATGRQECAGTFGPMPHSPSRTSMSTWRSGGSSTQYGCRATKCCNRRSLPC